ncbi:hypothetical protein PMAC_001798 [Pneumocystis sp. 'macacae']|nr:hypothetical protein PMAC_001798 [Pneumocystis sp. 'macacae']
MAPTSNNALFVRFADNPFPCFFRRGLSVSLSTDDPCVFHFTADPLLEEYAVAAQLWRLSPVDLCELARSSVVQSGFELVLKRRWLGTGLDSPSATNVPGVRTVYRVQALCAEHAVGTELACLQVEALRGDVQACRAVWSSGCRRSSECGAQERRRRSVDAADDTVEAWTGLGEAERRRVQCIGADKDVCVVGSDTDSVLEPVDVYARQRAAKEIEEQRRAQAQRIRGERCAGKDKERLQAAAQWSGAYLEGGHRACSGDAELKHVEDRAVEEARKNKAVAVSARRRPDNSERRSVLARKKLEAGGVVERIDCVCPRKRDTVGRKGAEVAEDALHGGTRCSAAEKQRALCRPARLHVQRVLRAVLRVGRVQRSTDGQRACSGRSACSVQRACLAGNGADSACCSSCCSSSTVSAVGDNTSCTAAPTGERRREAVCKRRKDSEDGRQGVADNRTRGMDRQSGREKGMHSKTERRPGKEARKDEDECVEDAARKEDADCLEIAVDNDPLDDIEGSRRAVRPDKHKDCEEADGGRDEDGREEGVGPGRVRKRQAEPVACKEGGSRVEGEIEDEGEAEEVEAEDEGSRGRGRAGRAETGKGSVEEDEEEAEAGDIWLGGEEGRGGGGGYTEAGVLDGKVVEEEVSVDLGLEEDEVDGEDDVVELNVFVGKAFAAGLGRDGLCTLDAQEHGVWGGVAMEEHPRLPGQPTEAAAMAGGVAEGCLAKWNLVVAVVAVFNTVQAYVSVGLTQRMYGRSEGGLGRRSRLMGAANALGARLFGTWTLVSAVVRLYGAYHIGDAVVYEMTLWTYYIAALHFVSEWLVFRSCKFGVALAGPLVVSKSDAGSCEYCLDECGPGQLCRPVAAAELCGPGAVGVFGLFVRLSVALLLYGTGCRRLRCADSLQTSWRLLKACLKGSLGLCIVK